MSEQRYLTPSMICRNMIFLLRRELEPGMLERGQNVPNVIWGDMLQRHVEFEPGDMTQSLDDYAEYMVPHAMALASLLRMADAQQVFDLPLPEGFVCCRHTFDGISLRLIVQPSGNFRFDILFRPRPPQSKRLIDFARISESHAHH